MSVIHQPCHAMSADVRCTYMTMYDVRCTSVTIVTVNSTTINAPLLAAEQAAEQHNNTFQHDSDKICPPRAPAKIKRRLYRRSMQQCDHVRSGRDQRGMTFSSFIAIYHWISRLQKIICTKIEHHRTEKPAARCSKMPTELFTDIPTITARVQRPQQQQITDGRHMYVNIPTTSCTECNARSRKSIRYMFSC